MPGGEKIFNFFSEIFLSIIIKSLFSSFKYWLFFVWIFKLYEVEYMLTKKTTTETEDMIINLIFLLKKLIGKLKKLILE